MHEDIGQMAGAVWHALKTRGELSLVRLKKEVNAKGRSVSNQPASDRPSRTILCIDDNRFGLAIRKPPLEARGFKVLTALSGQDGLAMLDRFSVDTVLLDYKGGGHRRRSGSNSD